MNIIEAIKSGKPFRRKGWDYTLTREEMEDYSAETYSQQHYKLSYRSSKGEHGVVVGCFLKDILADDWEVQEEKLELTWEEIQKSYHESQVNFIVKGTKQELDFYRDNSQLALMEFKRRLGFTE